MIPERHFIITIDTEGDNLWKKPRHITTENARYLNRFQRISERYGFKPTYLVNYEMATCPIFQKFGRVVVEAGTAEIGMHLHAWNSPPEWPLTDDDYRYQPFLIEYPVNVIYDKITHLTDLLRETFLCDIVSHRAGRWAINADYIRILSECGYTVDCSVTPHVSWKSTLGDPGGAGGPDYSRFPDRDYVMDIIRIEKAGDSSLLQVPMTIIPTNMFYWRSLIARPTVPSLFLRLIQRFFPPLVWLRPNGRNRRQMEWLIRKAAVEDRDYLMFMLHSSELMPGGSSRFDTDAKIEKLYDDLNAIFSLATNNFVGATLSEFRIATAKKHLNDTMISDYTLNNFTPENC